MCLLASALLWGKGQGEDKYADQVDPVMKKNQYWITVYRPNEFDHAASLDATARQDIDKLNDEMAAAGVRVFVGGLRPVAEAKSIQLCPDGTFVVADGGYLAAASYANNYVDGFWILTCEDLEEAMAWGRKAAAACRASVEVRPFYG